jgi:hypothetical protein
MKAFQEKAQRDFNAQAARAQSLAEVRELSFSNCSLSPALLQTQFPQLTGLSRLTLVDMKPALNDASFEAILSAIPAAAKQNTFRMLDVSDNKITKLSASLALPKLTRLLMANNNVASLDNIFSSSVDLSSLRTLDLGDNDVSDEEAKRAFARCPSLVVCNGKNKAGDDFHDPSDADFDGEFDDEAHGDAEVFLDEEDDEEDDEEEDEDDVEGALPKESPARRERVE